MKGMEWGEDEKKTKRKYSGEGKREWIGKSHGSYKEERRGMKREEREEGRAGEDDKRRRDEGEGRTGAWQIKRGVYKWQKVIKETQSDLLYRRWPSFKGILFIRNIFIGKQFKNFIPFCNLWGPAGSDATMENMPHTQTNKPLDQVCSKQKTRLKVGHQCLW